MKNFKILSLLAMVMVFSLGFVSCSDDDDDSGVGDPKPYSANLNIKVTADKRLCANADLNVYYTDLEGNKVDLVADLAENGVYEFSDSKKLSEMTLPMDLTFVFEYIFKDDAPDGSYGSYTIDYGAWFKTKDGEDVSPAAFRKQGAASLNDRSRGHKFSYAGTFTVEKDDNGKYNIEVKYQ